MRRLCFVFALIVMLCGGCALVPDGVPAAPYEGARAVVFDIDGTLTPDVCSIFSVRPHAVDVVRLYAERGFKIVYLSARRRAFQFNIPSWLEKNEFPPGSLHVPSSAQEGRNPAAYKTQILAAYCENGWKLSFAYGDSSTDFAAYASAGIPGDAVFALQRRGETACRDGAWGAGLSDWKEHLLQLESERPVVLP